MFNTMMGDAKFIEILMKNIFARNAIRMATHDTLSKVKTSFMKGEKYCLIDWNKKNNFREFFPDVFMARLQHNKNGPQRLNRFVDLINQVCLKSRTNK